jgi:hypothetical protein
MSRPAFTTGHGTPGPCGSYRDSGYKGRGGLGLYFGGRRWLGRFGGVAAVGLYCSSGAAILFAWRDYMPTFTEASLIAAGTGALLWAVLAAEASTRRRTLAGIAVGWLRGRRQVANGPR